jgi:hypothetical protein
MKSYVTQATRGYSLQSRNISSSSLSRPQVFARGTWWASNIHFLTQSLLWGYFRAGKQRLALAPAID